MAITKEVRKKLRRLLPKNYRLILSQQLDVHPQTIGNTLYGRTRNLAVEIALLELAKTTQEQRDKEKQQADILTQQLGA
jgi:mRNA-degrading endonuclease RelE of RelBE toxin-antitoxin system